MKSPPFCPDSLIISVVNDGPSLLILSRLPHAQYASASCIPRASGAGRLGFPLLSYMPILNDDNIIMVVVVQNVLPIFILATGPQAQDAALTIAATARGGVCSLLVYAGGIETIPDA